VREATILNIVGLSFGYGQTDLLKEVSIDVRDEIVALIGANGAGKTTLVNVISGIRHPARGSIAWLGRDISRTPAHKIVSAGIAQVPEGRHVFPNQSVLVNLRLGGYARRRDAPPVSVTLDKIFALFPRLYERRQELAGGLSGGEQQMLAIGRALMSGPKLLILDEPSMGLAPMVVSQIFESLDSLRRDGISILLVEQNARLALRIADRGYVLENGRIVLEGSASSLVMNSKVAHAYLGTEVEASS
jgi:branched-chain amino acid transport system ATP-binding protein